MHMCSFRRGGGGGSRLGDLEMGRTMMSLVVGRGGAGRFARVFRGPGLSLGREWIKWYMHHLGYSNNSSEIDVPQQDFHENARVVVRR